MCYHSHIYEHSQTSYCIILCNESVTGWSGGAGDAFRNRRCVAVLGQIASAMTGPRMKPTYREQSACHEGGGGRLAGTPSADDDALDVP